jgi:hypothetical protein
MGIKPTGLIRLHNNMNSKEINQNQDKISRLDGNEILRVTIADSGKNKAAYFKVYKNTFSERSLVKLEKLKNIFLHKNLSLNEKLTKGIKVGQSISMKELKDFLKEAEHNKAINQKDNPKELKENASPNELMGLVNELGLEGITLDYLKSATNIKTESHKNNQKEVKSTIQDDDLMKMLDDLQGDGKADELDAILNELNTNKPDDDLDKNLEKLEILIERPQDSQLEITKNDIGLPPPTDDIGPPPPNYIPDPPSIKQIHISNLERAMDLGGMNFDENTKNYEKLNRQKEIVETTIKQIASASTLKKSERINEGRGSLSNLKLELKREFQNLMIMANKNGYQTENWIKRTADLDSALRSIDFIQEKKSSWF